jgi:acyl-homoserine lactone synthase
MIHIVTSENRQLYAHELATMRALRREQLADKAGWVDLIVVDEAPPEGPCTVHLLAFDDQMRLEAALRLDPTEDHCLLAQRFSHLVAPGETPKTGRDVWQAVDLFTTPVLRARPGADTGPRLFELWTAAVELAVVNGVARIVGVIDMALYPGVLNTPLDARLVGVPRPYALGVAAGIELALSQALRDRMRESLGLAGPVGYHVDALDLRAFGGLAAAQRQVVRAQVPQAFLDSARNEALAAETLYRLNDMSSRDRQTWADRGVDPPSERLNA